MAKKPVFELVGKKPTIIDAINPLAEKVGQKNTHPAVDLTFTTSLPNKEALAMLHPSLLAICYCNTGKGTGQLEGIQVVSDVPNLTEFIQRIGGEFPWEYEQAGCTLKIYNGETPLEFKDVTVKKIKVVCHEGGTVDLTWHAYTADMDAERSTVALLKSLTRDVELVAPDVVSDKQQKLEPVDGDNVVVGAFAAAVAAEKKRKGEVSDVTAKPGKKK